MDRAIDMICAKCGRHPSDMLILICSHNLCLLCSSKSMVTETYKHKESHVNII